MAILTTANRPGRGRYVPPGAFPFMDLTGGGASQNVEDFIGTPQEWTSALVGLGALRLGPNAGQPTVNPFDNSGSAIRTIMRDKNPAITGQIDTAIGRLPALQSQNQAAMNRYIAGLGRVSGQSQDFANQEAGAVGRVYSGELGSELAGHRQRYEEASRGNIAQGAQRYADIRARYGDAIGSEIENLSKALTEQLGTYESDLNKRISGEEAGRAGLRTQDIAAGRRAADLAIGTGRSTAAAMYAGRGGAGSGAALRSLVLPQMQAEAALAQREADLTRSDYENIAAQRQQYADMLAGLRRDQLGDISGLRRGLTGDITGMESSAAGWETSANDALARALYDASTRDTSYLTGLQGSLAGRRRALQLEPLQDPLAEISARNANEQDYLRNLGSLSQLDLANRFYGLEDPTMASAPNSYYFNPRRSEQINFPSLPPVMPSYMPSEYGGYSPEYGGAPAAGRDWSGLSAADKALYGYYKTPEYRSSPANAAAIQANLTRMYRNPAGPYLGPPDLRDAWTMDDPRWMEGA